MKKAEKVHVAAVVAIGCIACYVDSGELETPAEVHHVRAGCGGAQRSSWFKILPLCTDHHRHGENGKIAIHRGSKTFSAKYGTEEELLILVESLI
ncbi:TPA: hypothetical protein U5E25_001602 [Yersinia enterocolitica]|nr:hypothetical protein [Yersinia enterocolitica]